MAFVKRVHSKNECDKLIIRSIFLSLSTGVMRSQRAEENTDTNSLDRSSVTASRDWTKAEMTSKAHSTKV